MEYQEAIEYHNLLKRLKRCTRGTKWKKSVAAYWLNRLLNTRHLRREILSGRYRISKYLWFIITEPKRRDIYASHIKDRQYQHALIDDIVYPAVTRTFIAANCACQQDKGTKFCVDIFLAQLREFARIHGNNAYALQCDIKGYFPNSNHDIVSRNTAQYVDPYTARACEDVIRSFAEIEFTKILMATGAEKRDAHNAGHRISSYLIYGGDWKRVVKGLSSSQIAAVTERIRQGDFKGVGLGSQVTQITQIALLNDMDHYITEMLGIQVYARYMDDFILAHESKKYLGFCRDKITEFLAQKKLTLNPKTQLYPLSRGIILLHWRIRVGVTGKVVIHKHRSNIRKERRKLRKQKKLLDAGKISMTAIENSFQCWQAGILQQKCYMQVIQLRRLFYQLFNRRAPEWNAKRRELKRRDKVIISSMPTHIQMECCVDGMRPQ
ncbi:MAG: RNA-directed DNA polymerase [Acidaminococcaceae bacterium]|nr:RNA-directed DNA polymerase [Acidaminococcaceae bacterium]